jgi:hypothetical protein
MDAIRTAIDIEASSQRVWNVLTDFEAYPDWNPLFPEMTGDLAVGSKLRFRITPPGGRSMKISPTVLAVTPPRELRWRGGLPIPGLFSGEHSFRLEPRGEASTHLLHEEHFSGIMVPLFGGTLRKTERGFEEMNRALKARCEATT